MIDFFLASYKDTPWLVIVLEAITFFFGIASVYYAKKENILVYPTGLIATTITVYLFYRTNYIGDMVVNFYYSVMSIYGWYLWAKKKDGSPIVQVSRTNTVEKLTGIGVFLFTIIVIFAIYKVFGYEIKTDNYIDIFVSGLFFTAMWFMALKKIENWTLWIIGDLIAVPLYAYRGYGILAVEYIAFTILAILAYIEWRKILNSNLQIP
ncbi:nicotinamide riboside transporter PnuC [Flavobacterium sp.]|uniref:nicotinamide riboside transporter PnuC n=1 Tax=Flavobacterium sp. TaxID=239 RepID=UPI0039E3C928